tara:strand:+ start:838 stop:1323 length:486 start_codon:yes stop_codon:yes gene_type:complete
MYSSTSLSNELHHQKPSSNTSSNKMALNITDATNLSTSNNYCDDMMKIMFSGMFKSMHNGMMSMMHGGTSNHTNHHISAIEPDNIPNPKTTGAQAFSKNCSQCHALPSPSAHTAQEWPAVIERMKGYMSAQNRSALDKDELEDLTEYLTKEKESIIAMPGK